MLNSSIGVEIETGRDIPRVVEVMEEMKIQFIFLVQMLVLPSEAKGVIKDTFMPVGDTIVPIGLVRDRAVHGMVLKRHVRSQDDMGKSIQFRIRGDPHLNAWETIDNV